MADLKIRPTGAAVEAFLDGIPDEQTRRDCRTLLKIMRKATGTGPRMWGPSIVGFGSYHFKYESGREGDWFLTGFSPRKRDLTVYVMAGFSRYEALMRKLGRHKTGKSCLHVRRLSDVDLGVLTDLVTASVAHMRKTHRV